MSRRDWLIGLIVLEALLWMFMMSQSASGPDSTISATLFGARIFPLGLLLLIAVCALPIVIGALSRSWQGAIALNLIASLPALVFFVLGALGYNSQSFGASLLYILTPLAALGWFGWLLRFVRAEFRD